jgi:hypothetical protein
VSTALKLCTSGQTRDKYVIAVLAGGRENKMSEGQSEVQYTGRLQQVTVQGQRVGSRCRAMHAGEGTWGRTGHRGPGLGITGEVAAVSMHNVH